MEIELKKVKFYEELSEETPCYVAELYVESKSVAKVKNDGRGGCADVYYTEGIRSESAQKVERYIKDNPIVVQYNWGKYEIKTVEDLADHLFDEWLRKKESRRRK